jgi:hypothetical protein
MTLLEQVQWLVNNNPKVTAEMAHAWRDTVGESGATIGQLKGSEVLSVNTDGATTITFELEVKDSVFLTLTEDQNAEHGWAVQHERR